MFGTPTQTDDPVRCFFCGESYRDCDIILKHAGRTEEGDFWNCKCPECGQMNAMQEEYAQMSDEEFREEQHRIARDMHEYRKEQRR